MPEINIKGVQKSSLIDYPGKIATVVFLSKCNFRCPFCHNPELVFDSKEFPDITLEEFEDYLEDKKKWIDGVCITGGEPTLHPGLIDFMKLIKSKGLLVKLDTNGIAPNVIQKALDEKCVDYIAMDIKNSLDKYPETTNSKVDTKKVLESIKLLNKAQKEGLVETEFRSTLLPRHHNTEDLKKMAELIHGAKKFTLQHFKTEQALVDMTYVEEKGFLLKDLEEFKKLFEGHCEIVDVR